MIFIYGYYFLLNIGIFGMAGNFRLPGFMVVSIFIILRVSSNCLMSLFTSWIEVPLPLAIRWRRELFRIAGFVRSAGVME